MLRDVAARWNVLHGLTQSPRQTPPYRAGRNFPRALRNQCSRFLAQAALSRLSEFGTRGELHLKRRSVARRRHHPDAAAVHLDDLLGNGEAQHKPRAPRCSFSVLDAVTDRLPWLLLAARNVAAADQPCRSFRT